MIIVICQGHSGSRLLSRSLQESGIWMGNTNSSGDIVPPNWPESEPPLYEAAREINRHVRNIAYARWDFTPILSMLPTDSWWASTYSGIASVVQASEPRGWKLPETLFSLPWLTKRFPHAHYVRWIRDPRGIIAGRRPVDNFEWFRIPHKEPYNTYTRRAIAWKYQYDLVKTTPKPRNWIEVHFEDFAFNQARVLDRLSDFIGTDLVSVSIDEDRVYDWESIEFRRPVLQLLESGMVENIPEFAPSTRSAR